MRVEARQALIIVACVVAVFAVFFELGRLTRGNSETSSAYGTPTLPAVSVNARIPYGLLAAPPIPSLVVAKAPAPQPSPSSAQAVTGSSSGHLETSSGAFRQSTQVQSRAPTPTPTRAPEPVKAAPVKAAPAPVSHPRPAPQTSEGGSFDSSG